MRTKVALQVHHKCDSDEQEKASALCFEYHELSEFSGCCYSETALNCGIFKA